MSKLKISNISVRSETLDPKNDQRRISGAVVFHFEDGELSLDFELPFENRHGWADAAQRALANLDQISRSLTQAVQLAIGEYGLGR